MEISLEFNTKRKPPDPREPSGSLWAAATPSFYLATSSIIPRIVMSDISMARLVKNAARLGDPDIPTYAAVPPFTAARSAQRESEVEIDIGRPLCLGQLPS